MLQLQNNTLSQFYHVTHRDNLRSILASGLQLRYARNQKNPWLWLTVEPTVTLLSHVAICHDWHVRDLTILSVQYRRLWCVTHPLNICHGGLAYKTRRDISPTQMFELTDINLSKVA